MNKAAIKLLMFIYGVLTILAVNAFELTPQAVNGVYQLAIPQRSAAGQTQKLKVEFGEMNGQKILATSACARCPGAGYKMQNEASRELGRPVFYNSMGIYIIAYDENTFVAVMADAPLGKKSLERA